MDENEFKAEKSLKFRVWKVNQLKIELLHWFLSLDTGTNREPTKREEPMLLNIYILAVWYTMLIDMF